ncbi:MAG: hypothetical protein E7242_00350 [Lachnospiraceae bacterium]|nr:hypothetical protein [Lachnospiraceae bacterium]
MRRTIIAVLLAMITIFLVIFIPYMRDYVGQYNIDSEDTSKLSEDEKFIYRTFLSDAGKQAYDQVKDSVKQINTAVELFTHLDESEISDVINAVYFDHPGYFWLDTSYKYYLDEEGLVARIELEFNIPADKIKASKKKFNKAAKIVLKEAKKLETDAEKEKYVHDYLLDNVSYVDDAGLNQSAYSALVGKESVCAGYARAFQYLMLKLGIPCYTCVGEANGEDHAWNIVIIDGIAYNVDVAWDDPESGNVPGEMSYYNVSGNIISLSHTRKGMSEKLPQTI